MAHDSKTEGAGALEDQVMASVWAAGGCATVRQVVDDLNGRRASPLAYTTVMTVMTRLAEKGSLGRRRAGRGYVYEATASDPAGVAVNRVLREHGDAALAHFLEEAGQDEELRGRLRAILGGDDG